MIVAAVKVRPYGLQGVVEIDDAKLEQRVAQGWVVVDEPKTPAKPRSNRKKK